MSVTATAIRDELREIGLLNEQAAVTDTDSLMDYGIIDSLRLMELLMRLEATYGISVHQDDLTPDNFDSIESIARYVSARVGVATD